MLPDQGIRVQQAFHKLGEPKQATCCTRSPQRIKTYQPPQVVREKLPLTGAGKNANFDRFIVVHQLAWRTKVWVGGTKIAKAK